MSAQSTMTACFDCGRFSSGGGKCSHCGSHDVGLTQS